MYVDSTQSSCRLITQITNDHNLPICLPYVLQLMWNLCSQRGTKNLISHNWKTQVYSKTITNDMRFNRRYLQLLGQAWTLLLYQICGHCRGRAHPHPSQTAPWLKIAAYWSRDRMSQIPRTWEHQDALDGVTYTNCLLVGENTQAYPSAQNSYSPYWLKHISFHVKARIHSTTLRAILHTMAKLHCVSVVV